MQITPDIEKKYGTWVDVMTPFITSSAYDDILRFLKSESQKGKVICPKSVDTYRSLEYCDRYKLKAVVVLMDPYPTMKNSIMVSNGIPMDCSNTGVSQASLDMWYSGIEKEYGFMVDMDQKLSLKYLLEEEYVLLVNSSLTVELGKVGSHSITWKPFMEHLFKVLNESYKGLPIVLCGTAAQKYEKEINPLLHYVLKVEHPVAASYANRSWDTGGMFKWVNQILESNNGPEYKVNWWRLKAERKYPVNELAPWLEDRQQPIPDDPQMPF